MDNVKKVIGKIHLWLGLASGLVVFIIAVTGCLYAFQAEIQNATQRFRFVEARNKAMLPPSVLKRNAENELPGKHVHAVLYAGQSKAAQVIFFNFEPDYYYYLVYVNPYSGDVLRVKDMSTDFFRIVLDGHFYLWLPPHIGQPVVATATLIFVALLLSGLFLWWPKKKKGVKQRLKVRWNSKWRRRNYDLHNVLGFYAMIVLLVLAITGLVWGFEWFAKTYYAAAGGKKSLVYSDPLSDTTNVYHHTAPAIDQVWVKMKQLYPTAETIEVHPPETTSGSIAANANPDADTYYKTDYRYFDQNTLEELHVDHIYDRYDNASVADKLFRMNYDIHTGAVFGLTGKVLAFLCSLICASLPVTGLFIWIGRNRKKVEKKHYSASLAKSVRRPRHPVRADSLNESQ